MYKLVLISKYLRRKIAPMFAALAVTVCTMMVIIVMSVMGGFLDLLRSSVQQVTGDLIVDAATYTGFPYYQQLIDELVLLPEVDGSLSVQLDAIEKAFERGLENAKRDDLAGRQGV